MIINSFFTLGGIPATGLVPTIRIWQVSNQNNSLIITDQPIQEVGDGFYKYEFITYDPTNNYVIRVDGGDSLPPNERYNVAATEEAKLDSTTISNITNSVWDETATNHIQMGSMGAYQNETHADVQQIFIDTNLAVSLLETLLKYEQNRTKIDKAAMTLTVYDNDGLTPIKVFNLRDGKGNPSVQEVCERIPAVVV